MTRDTQETVDLMTGLVTRAMAKKVEEENKGIVVMFMKSFCGLAL